MNRTTQRKIQTGTSCQQHASLAALCCFHLCGFRIFSGMLSSAPDRMAVGRSEKVVGLLLWRAEAVVCPWPSASRRRRRVESCLVVWRLLVALSRCQSGVRRRSVSTPAEDSVIRPPVVATVLARKASTGNKIRRGREGTGRRRSRRNGSFRRGG